MSDRLSCYKSLVEVLLLFKLSLLLLFGPGLSSISPDLKRNVSTWIGERLTLPSTADFSCFWVFFPPIHFFVVILSLIAIILFACALQTTFPKP